MGRRLQMPENLILSLVYDVLDLADGHIKLLGQGLKADAVDEPAL